MKENRIKNIDEYISEQEVEVQLTLQKIRTSIQEIVPEAVETISYSMPAFRYKGKILVYFAAMKNHIGFYPTNSPILYFSEELAEYKTSKGTVQFPKNKPIPYNLIKKIVQYRVFELKK